MTKPSQESAHRISVLSGYSLETINEVFEALVVYATLQQLEGQPFVIPNIGKVSMTYRGDTIERGGKRAMVDVGVELDPYIVRCVGQIHDGDLTDAEIRMREMNERFLAQQIGG